MGRVQAVTGAFGYSGKYIARRLLGAGQDVITLTNSVHRANTFGGRVPAYPFHFDQPERLTTSLRGVSVLDNTYWVRFNHTAFSHADTVRNTLTLLRAAQAAGVERVVHVSITNPSLDSPLEYFRGKAELERALIASGMAYAILRPTVLFGKEAVCCSARGAEAADARLVVGRREDGVVHAHAQPRAGGAPRLRLRDGVKRAKISRGDDARRVGARSHR